MKKKTSSNNISAAIVVSAAVIILVSAVIGIKLLKKPVEPETQINTLTNTIKADASVSVTETVEVLTSTASSTQTEQTLSVENRVETDEESSVSVSAQEQSQSSNSESQTAPKSTEPKETKTETKIDKTEAEQTKTEKQQKKTESNPTTAETKPKKTEPNSTISETKPKKTEPVQKKSETTKSTTKSNQKNSGSGRIIVQPATKQWNLIVVNSSREIPKGYKPKLKEILGCGKYLDYRVAPHYEDMYYAAKKDGITLTPYSAYRSYEHQETNYNNLTNQYMSQYSLSRKDAAKKAATVILPPGTSEHNLGIAMDICNTNNSFANSKEYAWLTKNAHKYGFILRYTAEKQPITGIVPEPWHWRYVGVEYAEKIKNSGLCLEEYLDSIGVAY